MLIHSNVIREITCIISFTLWITCIFVAFFLGGYTLVKIHLKKSNPGVSDLQKKNIITWAICYILMGIVILLFTIWFYFIENQQIASIIDSALVLMFHIAIFVKI